MSLDGEGAQPDYMAQGYAHPRCWPNFNGCACSQSYMQSLLATIKSLLAVSCLHHAVLLPGQTICVQNVCSAISVTLSLLLLYADAGVAVSTGDCRSGTNPPPGICKVLPPWCEMPLRLT